MGDKLYGADPRFYLEFVQTGWTPELEKNLLTKRQLLHASYLGIRLAATEKMLSWKAPLPVNIQAFLTEKLTLRLNHLDKFDRDKM